MRNCRSKCLRAFCTAGGLLAVVFVAAPASGQSIIYAPPGRPPGTFSWSDSSNWFPTGLPGNGSLAMINFVFGGTGSPNDDANNTRTITYDYTGPAVTLALLDVDLSGGDGVANTSVTMSANTLSSQFEVVGDRGVGQFLQSGGTNNIVGGYLDLGAKPGSNGTYTLSGNGTLSANGTEYIADQGTANFTHSGGSNSATTVYVGYAAGSNGTYTLSGNGSLSVGIGGEFIGVNGTGGFTQTGGTNTISNDGSIVLGENAGSSGTFSLSGGSVSVNGDTLVGISGAGTFNQSGGSLSSTGTLMVALSSGSSGTYTLSAGTLTAPNAFIGGSDSGVGGTGVLTVSGTGSLSVSGTLTVYNMPGSAINLNGGTISTGTLNLSGNPALFNWTSGTLNLTNSDLFVDATGLLGATVSVGTGKALGVSGTLTVNNAPSTLLTLNGGTINTSTLNLSGNPALLNWTSGTLNLTNIDLFVDATGLLGATLSLGTGKALGVSGNLTVNNAAGASLTLNGGTITTGALNLSGNPALLNWTSGTLHLTNSSFTVDSNTGTALPLLTAAFTLSAGQTLSVNGAETVGDTGTGTFNQPAGNNVLSPTPGSSTDLLLIAAQPGSTGTYNLSGTGSIFSPGIPGVEIIVGASGNGTFNQSGGTISSTSGNFGILVGRSAQSVGDYRLSGGIILVAGEIIGGLGIGTFEQTGGSNQVTGGMAVGENRGSQGTYTLSAGTLSAISLFVAGSGLGAGGQGVLTVNGTGSLTIPSTGRLIVYNTPGSAINLNGGTISTGTLNLSGNPALFNWTAGTLALTNSNFTVDSNTATALPLLTSSFTLADGQTLSVSGSETVGNTGTGTFTQTGSSNTAGNLVLGNLPGSSGTYNLSGNGTLTAKNVEYVGSTGTGIFNQSGGTNTINEFGSLQVGYSRGTGTYNLCGNGQLSTALNSNGTEIIGNDGIGFFNQNGGTNSTGSLIIAEDDDGRFFGSTTGTYTLTAGTLNGGDEFIGEDTGSGTLKQTGGSNSATSVSIGVVSGSYSMSGGSLEVSGSTYVGGSANGPGGSGTLNISGTASVNIAGTLVAYNTPGTSIINFSGGNLTVGDLNFNGTPALFNWTGGTLTISHDIVWDSSLGTTSTSAAFGAALTLSANQTLAITGNETLGGGDQFALTVKNGAVHTVSGTLTVSGNGVLQVSGGQVQANSLMIAAGGSLTGNGTIVGNIQSGGAIGLVGTGSLNIAGNLTQTSTALLSTILTNDTALTGFEPLIVSGNLTLDGRLFVLPGAGFAPAIGDRFDLFEASAFHGAFSTVMLPTLSGNELWDTRLLDSEGILSVIDKRFLPGDLNRDTDVNVADILKLESVLTDPGEYQSVLGLTDQQFLQIADVNDDGLVNNADLQALINLLLAGGGSAAPVPEPSALGLAAIALCALVVGSRIRARR